MPSSNERPRQPQPAGDGASSAYVGGTRGHIIPQPRVEVVVTGREQVEAARDALARARDADERLRSALAEATVWLTLAVTDDTPDDGES